MKKVIAFMFMLALVFLNFSFVFAVTSSATTNFYTGTEANSDDGANVQDDMNASLAQQYKDYLAIFLLVLFVVLMYIKIRMEKKKARVRASEKTVSKPVKKVKKKLRKR